MTPNFNQNYNKQEYKLVSLLTAPNIKPIDYIMTNQSSVIYRIYMFEFIGPFAMIPFCLPLKCPRLHVLLALSSKFKASKKSAESLHPSPKFLDSFTACEFLF